MNGNDYIINIFIIIIIIILFQWPFLLESDMLQDPIYCLRHCRDFHRELSDQLL